MVSEKRHFEDSSGKIVLDSLLFDYYSSTRVLAAALATSRD